MNNRVDQLKKIVRIRLKEVILPKFNNNVINFRWKQFRHVHVCLFLCFHFKYRAKQMNFAFTITSTEKPKKNNQEPNFSHCFNFSLRFLFLFIFQNESIYTNPFSLITNFLFLSKS